MRGHGKFTELSMPPTFTKAPFCSEAILPSLLGGKCEIFIPLDNETNKSWETFHYNCSFGSPKYLHSWVPTL